MIRWLWLFFACTACVQPPVPEPGARIYRQACARCHDTGKHGAQRIGDREGWRSRLGQGRDTLLEHSILGFEGAVGHMPPRGGNPALSDADVAAALDYLLEQSR